MTYKDILDTIAVDGGDLGTAYRANAIRWLNFVRQECATRGSWKSAKYSEATISTDPNNLSGIYALPGYNEVIGGEMYDMTHRKPIERDTENRILRMEVTPAQYGPPVIFADAGMTASGDKQVRFWPIPLEVMIVKFSGGRNLGEIASENELLTVDPYFGPLSNCGAMMLAGMKYYQSVNDNEDVSSIERAQDTFYKLVDWVAGQIGIDRNAATRLDPVNRRPMYVPRGRFDPGHYSNV